MTTFALSLDQIKAAAEMVKTGTYGMLYNGGADYEEMVWTGIQRLLISKGLDVPPDGKPGFRTYKALEQLAADGLADLNRRVGTELEKLESDAPETLDELETDEIDSARFRRLEKK